MPIGIFINNLKNYIIMWFSRENIDLLQLKQRINALEQRLDQLEIENKYLRNKILRRFKVNEPIGTEEKQDNNEVILPIDINRSIFR